MERKLFGEIALAMGWLTSGQLVHALEVQQRERGRDSRPPLGRICEELGYLTPERVRAILGRQQASPDHVH